MKSISLGNGTITVVDDEDYAMVSSYRWKLHVSSKRSTAYARCRRKKNYMTTCIYLHRLILGAFEKGATVDHIDGNGLNNTRSNLRLCTQLENCMNAGKRRMKNATSRHRGVSLVTTLRSGGGTTLRWAARCRGHFIGNFHSEIAAAAAYNASAFRMHGGFARMNKLFEQEKTNHSQI